MKTSNSTSFRNHFSENVLILNTYNHLSREEVFFQKVKQLIHTNIGNEQFSVELLAKQLHLSVSQLNRKLNQIINKPAGQLIRDMRMNHATQLLLNNAASVGEIAYQVGYENPTHFSRGFKRKFGCAPSEYSKIGMRKNGQTMRKNGQRTEKA